MCIIRWQPSGIQGRSHVTLRSASLRGTQTRVVQIDRAYHMERRWREDEVRIRVGIGKKGIGNTEKNGNVYYISIFSAGGVFQGTIMN